MVTASNGIRGLIDRFLHSFKLHPSSDRQLHHLMHRIDYTFRNETLLIQALKHRSYLVLTGEDRLQSNERLEFLGDAILGMVITEHLYHSYPKSDEGTLTNFKSLLVNRSNLSQVARELQLGDCLFLNESEERSGGRERESILADAFEALIGAMYLDGGLDPVRHLIQKRVAGNLKKVLGATQSKNYKSMLLEFCQKENMDGPIYVVEDEIGPDHCKTFTVAVLIDGRKQGIGWGPSKKLAEQKAAEEALAKFIVEEKKGR